MRPSKARELLLPKSCCAGRHPSPEWINFRENLSGQLIGKRSLVNYPEFCTSVRRVNVTLLNRLVLLIVIEKHDIPQLDIDITSGAFRTILSRLEFLADS